MNWERWSWVLAFGSASLLAATEPWLTDAIGNSRAFGVYGLGGLAIGWTWYHLYSRPLSEGLFSFACLFVLAVVLAFVPGVDVGETSITTALAVYVGVIAGLVLNEESREGGTWDRQRRTALTSRKTMDDLR